MCYINCQKIIQNRPKSGDLYSQKIKKIPFTFSRLGYSKLLIKAIAVTTIRARPRFTSREAGARRAAGNDYGSEEGLRWSR